MMTACVSETILFCLHIVSSRRVRLRRVPVCAACLKDLQRLLRQDESEGKEAFQVLGQYNIAKSDLVPIIVTYPKETEIVYNACKSYAESDSTA